MRVINILSSILFLALIGAGCGSVSISEPDGGDIDGPVDPCENAVCECEVDADCAGAHKVCDTSGPGRVCACAAGYELAGNTCQWGIAPRDPGFQDGTAWQVSRGAGVSPLSTGQIDPGEAFFSTDATCNLGEVWQTFEMPTYAQAEPLVAAVNYRSLGGMFGSSSGAGVNLNGGWRFFPVSTDWRNERVCLGERAYGGPVHVGVAAAEKPYDCAFSPTAMVAVDHLVITPAEPGECPAPGQVLNADFEEPEGWTGQPSGTGATAGITSGVGENGTRGGQMTTSQLCSGASLTGMASWPYESVQNPAIEVWWQGTSGKPMELHLDNRVVGQVVGTDTPQTARICIPPWARGSATTVRWQLPYTYGSCSTADVRDFRVDNIRVVNEPGCVQDPYILDGGFESVSKAGLATGWNPVYFAGYSLAELRNDSGAARNGAGVLRLMVQQQCYLARASTTVVVPQPSGTAGPVLKFYYRTGNNPESTFYSTPGVGALEENVGWQQSTVCLDPILAGRPTTVSFTIDRSSGTCANTFPAEYAWVDDIQLGTDASCPAE
jgi:hypothetical protein